MDYSKYLKELKENRRDVVIMCAAELFLERGIDNVKMTDVAERSEIGVATIYRYFGTKDNLVISVGELLWADMNELFAAELKHDSFNKYTGYEQVKIFLSVFITLYRDHKPILQFLRDFDSIMLREQIQEDALESYEVYLLSFFSRFEVAYHKGIKDGTLKKIDVDLYYTTVTHMLLQSCEKYVSGNIISIDSSEHYEAELRMMIDMALNYIKVD